MLLMYIQSLFEQQLLRDNVLFPVHIACECHPNGTQGFCDSLFGTCTCLNNNILGELCDECRDEYWGLSQGFPCIPCDCCSNGSSSNICNKVTSIIIILCGISLSFSLGKWSL